MRSENAVAFLDISWDSGPSQSGTCAGNLSYAPTDLPSCFARCNSDLDLVECEQIRFEILDRFGGCMSACSMSEQNEFWANRCDEDLNRCTDNGTLTVVAGLDTTNLKMEYIATSQYANSSAWTPTYNAYSGTTSIPSGIIYNSTSASYLFADTGTWCSTRIPIVSLAHGTSLEIISIE